jgi:replicative DNA helicase
MIKTENKELDFFWHLGLKPGGLILIAARPGMGKTSSLVIFIVNFKFFCYNGYKN